MDLQKRLEKKALDSGAAYFGVADLNLIGAGVVTPYEENFLSRYKFAVSIGVALNNNLVDGIADANEEALRQYYYHVYSGFIGFRHFGMSFPVCHARHNKIHPPFNTLTGKIHFQAFHQQN